MNILFVEDDQDLRTSVLAQLKSKGHTVYPTNDLAESWALLANEAVRIDLVISDHQLPDGYGIQFVIEAREMYPKCSYVVVSGCLTPKDVETLKRHRITYFTKPLLYSKVVETVLRKLADAAPIHGVPDL